MRRRAAAAEIGYHGRYDPYNRKDQRLPRSLPCGKLDVCCKLHFRCEPRMVVDSEDRGLFELLVAPAPAVSCRLAEAMAKEHFGLAATAKGLSSERDRNFHLCTDDGRDFVLKIANSKEHPGVTDFQSQALLHMASRDPQLPVPRVCTTLTGALQARTALDRGQWCTVRLLSYLPGRPIAGTSCPPALRNELGKCLARIGRCLSDFSHPHADHALLWDIKNAASLRQLVEHIAESDRRSLVDRYLEDFQCRVSPELMALRCQVIYNDLNPGNVLVDSSQAQRVTGIIDFGDMVRSPLVVDVAVAAAYQLRFTEDPLDAATEFIAAYHHTVPLEDGEIALLANLIAIRLVTSTIITSWRASIHPDNRDYIVSNLASNWRMLRILDGLPRHEFERRIRAACDALRR